MSAMNTCSCGGKFPTRTSGTDPDVTLCTSADQHARNLAARSTDSTPTPAPPARTPGAKSGQQEQ